MKIAILGSGLVGVTAAAALASRGHEVEVIDRGHVSGSETTFANGGQLSYSTAEPWANPGVLYKLPKWLLRSDAPLVFRPRADLEMVKWGLQFLRNCTDARARANTITLLRLGLYSRLKMHQLVDHLNLEYDYLDKGILHIYSRQKDFDAARQQADFQAKFGCEQNILTREECLQVEPALRHTDHPILGGIHAFRDEIGDPYLLCQVLAERIARDHSVMFRYGVNVKRLAFEGDRIHHVQTDQGDVKADIYMMALGSYSTLYLKPLGIRLPIYPMKGYSVTLPANEYSPNLSITEGSVKLVYTRLGNRLRIAGTAEFAGYNTQIRPKRIEPIVRAAKELFPQAQWDAPMEQWACLRPSTPDGPPYLGRTPYRNLFLNTGHGTLGWTQAAGSAYILADLIEGKQPEIPLHGLTLKRSYG